MTEIPNNVATTAGDHAASGTGTCFEAPSACKKLDIKNTINPIKIPAETIINVPRSRGGRRDTQAASKIIAASIKGCDNKLWK